MTGKIAHLLVCFLVYKNNIQENVSKKAILQYQDPLGKINTILNASREGPASEC